MRKLGYFSCTDVDGTREYHTFTCNHCNAVKVVPQNQKPEDIGGWCGCCTELICERCVALGSCTPFEKKMAQHEARYHARRSYGI